MDKKCEICLAVIAKYKCPGCFIQTCSLPCVKRHKSEQSCDGIRNKTEFVAVRKYSDINLLSDYRFLEDTGRKADSSNRDNYENRYKTQWKRNKLIVQCKKRDINLMMMPCHMTKPKENESRYDHVSQSIEWTVEWRFPQAETKYTNKVNDQSLLSVSLQHYIHPTESDPVIRHKLKPYVTMGTDHVKLFLKVEGRKTNSVRYYELDKEKSLCENLNKKLIIEYPTIHVVLLEHAEEYTLLKQDEAAQSESYHVLMTFTTSHSGQHYHGNQYHNQHGNQRGKKRRYNYKNRGRGRGQGSQRDSNRDHDVKVPKLDT